jgi:hypothetical protein
MTVEQEVDALTTAVDNLKSTVVSKKATLDASVVDAQSATSQAQSAKTAALSARDQANASKDAALGYAASAASAVAFQDLTALAESKAVTATDVFIYDTSKDSDGGAWRKRTQHTSWYNETLNTATRGSRREFPAVAVIVAESKKVTIYDGDDPDLPMWMVFNPAAPGTVNGPYIYAATGSRHLSSVSFANGQMNVGSTLSGGVGLFSIDFLEDAARLYSISSGSPHKHGQAIVGRNLSVTGQGYAIAESGQQIISNDINDVAMTVLPDAPIDPATGLPVPTIAVATAGGVSVIKDDGTVVSGGELNSGWTVTGLFFDGDATLWATEGTAYSGLQRMAVPPFESVASIGSPINDGYGYPYYNPVTVNTYGVPQNAPKLRQGGILYGNAMSAHGSALAAGNSAGISKVLHNSTSQLTSLVNYTTSTYNTGWMNGDIKGAFLSDTDDTDLVGSGELVTNGTFDTDTSGWTATDGTFTFASGEGLLTSDGSSQYGYANASSVPVVVGKTYIFSGTYRSGTANGTRLVLSGATSRNVGSDNASTTAKTLTLSFVAQTTSLFIQGLVYSADSTSRTGYFDNVSVKLADADRSVNNNGLIVNGTVTRTPVATGADLVAYSGFSASNYLEQPYNSDLDFGTGDFCVMGWLKGADTYCGLVDRGTGTAGFGNSFAVGGNATSKLYGKVGASSGYSSADVWSGTWRFVCLVRSSGVAYFFVDGLASGSFTATDNVTNTSAITRLGLRTDGAASFDGSSYMALWRISATAPTAEAIAKIYNDEKHLFVENAACTLAGTSDAVTALAHDSSTGLLHVGSSYGRSVFQGLRRVSNTTTAVGTAISASNGLVVEE